MNDKTKNRQSIRLQNYDYSQSGGYFVTMCAQNMKCVFGNIENQEMKLNKFGEIVKDEWLKTQTLRTNVILDQFVVMPNHFHGIILIVYGINANCRGTARRAPTCEQFGKPVVGSIPTIIRSFKSAVTKRINEMTKINNRIWQRNYYEHIIRNEKSLDEIRKYIHENPLKWNDDENNPMNTKNKS